jgi:hypothetical protein
MWSEMVCAFSGHQWLEWAYIAEGSCQRIRQCRRCADQETETGHVFAEWTPTPEGPCHQARPCVRCSSRETREEHFFAPEWRDEEVSHSPQGSEWSLLVCSRCGKRLHAAAPGHAA